MTVLMEKPLNMHTFYVKMATSMLCEFYYNSETNKEKRQRARSMLPRCGVNAGSDTVLTQ